MFRRDEGLEFISEFARNKERNIHDANRAYEMIVAREHLIEKARSISHYAQGAFVYAINQNDLWKQMEGVQEWWTFGEFCKQKLDMSLSKAVHLQKLWERAQWIGLLEEEIETLGWSLAGQVAKYCNSRTEVEKYVEMAEAGSKKQDILETLRRDKKIQAQKTRLTPMRLPMSSEQKNFWAETAEIVANSINKRYGYNIDLAECITVALIQWREAYGTHNGHNENHSHQSTAAAVR